MEKEVKEKKPKKKKEKQTFKQRLLSDAIMLSIVFAIGAIALIFIVRPYYTGEKNYDEKGLNTVIPDPKQDNRWKEREYDFDGIKYTYIYNPGRRENTEDYMTFMVFSSKRDAKKAYKLMMENDYDVTEEQDNYFIGWKKGVCDASIEQIVCLYGNRIVFADIAVYSEWAMSDDEVCSGNTYPEHKQYVLIHFAE